jgi:putative Mg2+ transporter-C (MgtC) family protein
MTLALAQFAQPLSFSWLQQLVFVNDIGRLLLASLLGGLVGIERQIHTKAYGMRTDLLICLGSAFFTLLSAVLAGDSSNKGQVASNIVQGIGFLGAGLILHNSSRVSGLASAATVWVVASIGMACGAGLYLAAAVSTGIVICAMELVGVIERRANIKRLVVVYETRGSDQTRMLKEILDVLDKAGQQLADVETNSVGDIQRVTFPLNAVHRTHRFVRDQLLAQPGISSVFTFHDSEQD